MVIRRSGCVYLTVSDVTSCKREVEVLAKGFYIVNLVVSNMPNSQGCCQQRAHTAAVGHVISTRYSTLSRSPYYPMSNRTTHCINLVPSKSIHFSGFPSISRILALAYGSPDSQDSYPYACILPASRDFSMTYLHLTRISELLGVSLVFPDSQDSFNT